MKTLFNSSLFFVGILFVGLNACSTFTKQKNNELGLNFKLIEKKMDNDLNVLMIEDHTVPIVSYQTWVNVGSVDETFGLTGLAHLFEHLMFKGSKNFGPKAFFQELEAKGASINAYTTRDYTVFHETFSKGLLDRVIQLESDRLSGLQLTDEVLYTEKQVVSEERRLRSENSPDGRMQEALWELAFKSHPYRSPVIGYPEDLNRVRLDDLHHFFSEYYQPGNITVVIVGDIDPDSTFEKMKTFYGDLPGFKRKKRNIALEPLQTEGREIRLNDSVASLKIAMGYPISSAADKDTHALDILSTILFEGVSSRAYQKIVEEKKLSLNVSGVSYTPLYPGLFMINATLTKGATVEQFKKAWEECLNEIKDKGVTAEELQMAVRQLTVQTVDSVRTSHGLATLIGTVKTILGDPNLYNDDLNKYEKVRSEDVINVARKYLTAEKSNVVILEPKKNDKGVQK